MGQEHTPTTDWRDVKWPDPDPTCSTCRGNPYWGKTLSSWERCTCVLLAAHATLTAQRDELVKALEWALDVIGIDEALIREKLPVAWATLDHDANGRAKAKARAALSRATPPRTSEGES